MTRLTDRMAPALVALFVGLALIVWGEPADAKSAPKEPDCPTGVLNLKPDNTPEFTEGAGVDIVIKVKCTARKGFTHVFGDVHIVKGGSLIFEDATADFWAASILVENGGALIAGTLDHPIGLSNPGNIVTIHLYGADQTCVNASGGPDPTCKTPRQGLGILCHVDPLRCSVPEPIWKSNAIVDKQGHLVPGDPKSAIKISAVTLGPNDEPYAGPVKDDYFYPYHQLPFDGALDGQAVSYFGYKVLGVSYGGTLQLFGRKGACLENCGEPSTTGQSWVRLVTTIGPHDTGSDARKLIVSSPVNWRKGDKIVVTTTDYLPGHSEELTVAADIDGGTTVTVEEQVNYIHNGSKYSLAGVRAGVLDETLRTAGAETRAAVALLSRNIRIVSEGNTAASCPTGKTTCFPDDSFFGGHVVIRQGFKLVQIQAVEFKQLGQGGRLGHYPVHFHHARKTAPTDADGHPLPNADKTFVVDSSINESMTRWIVLHGTHDVTLARNVGYKSIGHGFYLEDGTEINNKLLANLGIFARAAVDNAQNPRKVPGILAAPDLDTVPNAEQFPFKSDYDHPTVFWIMNGWNDFQYNMAAGAGTCGACYWLVGGFNSTVSRVVDRADGLGPRGPRWESYASMQSSDGRGAMTPLKSFIGNSCTSAMTSFQTIAVTEACLGVGPTAGEDPFLAHVRNPLAENRLVGSPLVINLDYYPGVRDGGRFPTQCVGPKGAHDPHADCSDGVMARGGTGPAQCSAANLGNCMITVLDRYTTSFNWAAFNFAAIWLRPQWYLMTDSVITDVQQAGLTMVTGGGYSESDVITGHWALVRKSAFVGHTQEDNPFASNAGPFNPGTGLLCAYRIGSNKDAIVQANYCLSREEGVSVQLSNFGMYQRLFSVYDGPAYQDSNAYLNIKLRTLEDCLPFVDFPNKAARCDFVVNDPNDATKKIFGRWTDPAGISHNESRWTLGRIQGLPKGGDTAENLKGFCYLPNAAIGWKQPNGFYYPPAFHSTNLFFAKDDPVSHRGGVDVRHFVVSPLFLEGTLDPDFDGIARTYCKWDKTLFAGFAGNDRQTVLNDDDGSLTGYKNTTVINLDDFFSAPVSATQCLSDDTSRTMPYEYVTTVLYPQCVTGTGSQNCARADANGDDIVNDGDWNRSCTSEQCYGIPLWRQDEMPESDRVPPKTGAPLPRSIRMMGQQTGQRSSLTVNHGTYYLDTTVGRATQLKCETPDPGKKPCVVNVFQKDQTYYLFLIFAKENTEQTYRFYVGPGKTDDPATELSMTLMQANIAKNPITFSNFKAVPATRVTWFDKANGVVQVVLNVKDLLPDFATTLRDAKRNKCQPATYCSWNEGAGTCEDKNPVDPNDKGAVCRWAIADLDCPDGGCVGIAFTMPGGPGGFATDPPKDPRPPALCVPRFLDPPTNARKSPFNVTFSDPDPVVSPRPPATPEEIAGACFHAEKHTPDDFCK